MNPRGLHYLFALVALIAWLAGCLPALAQPVSRPGALPNPLDQVRERATRPPPSAPAPEPPAERLVPERRVRIPETGQEIVIPPHYERRLSDQQSVVPPLTGYGAQGGGAAPIIPGGERPPAESRQGP